MTQNLWFTPFKSAPGKENGSSSPGLKLYCFHHAGAACQYFQPWASKLPSWIQVIGVQLPGRWNRIQEVAYTRETDLTPVIGAAFKQELLTNPQQPYAFYGHSLGGLVAYELTRFLTVEKQRLPVHLFISSKRAPQLEKIINPIYMLPDAEFEIVLTSLYGALPAEITSELDMKKLFLDITKKDMELLDTHQFKFEPIINVPLSVLGGLQDHVVTLQQLQPWKELTSGSYELLQFPGGHFFLREPSSEDKVLDLIVARLTAYKS